MSRATSSTHDGPIGSAKFDGLRRLSRIARSKLAVSPSITSPAMVTKAQRKRLKARRERSGPISCKRNRNHRRAAWSRIGRRAPYSGAGFISATEPPGLKNALVERARPSDRSRPRSARRGRSGCRAAVERPARGLDHAHPDHRLYDDAQGRENLRPLHGGEPDRHLTVILHEFGPGALRPVPGDRHVADVADENGAGVAQRFNLLRSRIAQDDVEPGCAIEDRDGAVAISRVYQFAAAER